jgi:UDP-N-acetylmuramate--alanine ligase
VLNCLAAIAAALELQVPLYVVRKALGNFSGIQRRFELKGEAKGVKVFDDYGHHPAEIRAVLKAARECFGGNRLLVIFQPHRYSRTRDLLDEFAKSFGFVDELFLLDIYPAGEKPIEGVNSSGLLKAIGETGLRDITYAPDRGEFVRSLLPRLSSGDVVITLGAGDVYKIGEEILKAL